MNPSIICCILDKSSGQCEHDGEMLQKCCLGGSWSLYLIKSQAVVAGVGGGEAGGDVSTHYGAYLQ